MMEHELELESFVEEEARRRDAELTKILQEHIDVRTDSDAGGFGLYVYADEDHALHIFHHNRFLVGDEGNLRTQDKSRLRKHIESHILAMTERAKLA